jgi:DNA repair protein RecO (recombination protein O)
MQRVDLEPAFVIHSRPYRDTSVIADLLTMRGRIAVIARSARGMKSRYKGILQLFSPILVSWTGQRELKSLGVVERQGPIYPLEGQSLICGFYLNELLQRLLQREDPHADIYYLYQDTLNRFKKEKDLRPALRCFEKNLLSALGYGLPLRYEASTRDEIIADAHYQYIPEQGFVRCYSDDNSPHFYSGQALLSLRHEQFDSEQTLQQAKRLLRLEMSRHLGNKPIKSRELFVKVS